MDNNELMKIILGQIKQPLWDNWYIEDEIGSGAYSSVYRIKAERMSRTDISAVKIAPIVPAENTLKDEEKKRRSLEERRDLAVNEADIMFKLKGCPYIVEYQEEDIRELYIDNDLEGYYYLIRMEYLDCVTNLIKERRFDFSEENIRKLAFDIGSGICAAHSLEIIHRDIKLGNFFLAGNGTYKLGDFNISQKTREARAFAGTPGYLAPEMYKARSDVNVSYTAKADIYSFGICLYQLMNDMYMPFEREMEREKAIEKRLSGVPVPPPVKASSGFADIILRACAYNEAERYQSIKELLEDLKKLNSLSQSADASSDRNNIWQNISGKNTGNRRKKNIAIAAAAAAAVLLVAGGITAGILFSRKAPDKSAAVISGNDPENMKIRANKDLLDIDIYEEISISDVTIPEVISISEADEIPINFVTETQTRCKNDELVLTVEGTGDLELQWDAPPELEIEAEKDGNKYYITFDGEKYKGTDAVCRVEFFFGDYAVSKTVKVAVTNTGPFRDSLEVVSADPEVLDFISSDGKIRYTINSTGTAELQWKYDDEIIYSAIVTIVD